MLAVRLSATIQMSTYPELTRNFGVAAKGAAALAAVLRVSLHLP